MIEHPDGRTKVKTIERGGGGGGNYGSLVFTDSYRVGKSDTRRIKASLASRGLS